ncbi:Ig-like domain-containing protein [Burkholderia multivorans]|uniref:Ig-like domain-containing protein n=15 Tax=Burkholderia multivorans TaxID=87883 RepID=UPI00057FD900|nr:Ig-like domain-containing protein [Burkholderia multivorans]KHS16508.1 calcium-binding protein [Burkholderia multivorans]KHS20337.1 calcium-binding protein [Burkholderia multivorans]MBR7924080.1 BapA prefix-like domain-containing protein [Burkholderia multivorans]MBR8103621.1 BapA prefix-like domain-containing protein [Burkholderia multivorans]MBR8339323.1 BapA prefix-like domain-containing protein [Burkholderia multivorans]
MVSSSVLSNHVDVPVAAGAQSASSPGGPANFLLSAHKEDVANYARSGNDLIVEFKDGRTLRVQAFFENGADYHNLVFVQDDGRFLVHFGSALQASGDGIVESAVAYAPIGDGLSTGALLGILGGVAAAGGIAAAAASGGGGDGGGSGGVGGLGGGSAPGRLTIESVAEQSIGGNASVVTRHGTPTITGSGAQPNAKVTIFIDGQPVGTVTADAGGRWSYTPGTLPDGSHQISVTQTDANGNSSAPAAVGVVIDTVVPGVPAITAVTDDAQHPIVSGGATNDTTPTLSGTAEAGSTINVYDGTTLIGTTTADASGHWTLTPAALGEGVHAITVTATDIAGNVSAPSAAFDLTVDTTAPVAPTVNPTDGTSLSGTAEAGATIQIDTNGDGVPDATVTADPSGTWTYTPSTPLPVGTQIGVTASDAAGNTSPAASVAVTGDVTAPAAPAIAGVTDDVGSVLGAIVSGGSTDDTTPMLTGTAEAGSTINIYDGTTLLGTTTADASGSWSFTPTTGLGEGTHSLTVTATDSSGNVSVPSAAFDLTVDTTAPSAPTVNPTDGTSLSGTAEAGATIQIDTNGDGTPDATVTAGPTGAWNYTPSTPLPVGTQIGVTASDAAGNKSPAASVTVTGDVTAPAAPAIAGVTDDVGSVLGAIVSGGSTDDTTPTLTGTAEAGSTISVYDGTTLLGTTTADASGNWTFTPATALGEGAHSLTVTATDASGNVSTPSAAFDLTVDTTAPSAPTVNPTDGTSLSGTAEAGATIQIDTNGDGTPDATVTADPTGAWTYTPSTPLPLGTQIGVTASDAAGNTSPSASVTVTGDVTAPAAPVIAGVTDDVGSVTGAIVSGGSTDDTTPTLTGTAEAGSTISVYDGTTLLGTTTADASGNWSFTPATALGEGAHSLTVTATDSSGNVSTPSTAFDLTVDTTAPAAPAVNATDGTSLSGAAEAGATIQIDTNGDGTPDATVTADASGTWTYTPSTPLPVGTQVTVTASDAAGNTSLPTSVTVTGDVTAPAAPVIAGVTDDVGSVTGAIVSGGSTDDTTPTLSGTAEAGSTINVYDGTTLLGSTTADASGNWSFTPAGALGEGAHSLTVTATDSSANVSVPSAAFDLTVDTTAPSAPTVNPTDGTSLSGTAEAGATIQIDTNGDGTPDATVTADPTGAWTYTPATPLPIGTQIGVTASDAAGNTSPSASVTVTGDVTAPAAPVITGVTDDVGSVLGAIVSGGSTDDTTPTLTGTAEAGSTISVYDGTTLLGTTTADASGNWSFTPATALGEGAHSLTVTATDSSGNVSTPSAAFDLTVDTTAPSAPTVNPTDGTSLSGTAEAGATIQIDTNGDGTPDATVTADPSGAWTYTPATPLPIGTQIGVTASDAAGNKSPAASVTVTGDVTAPAAPIIVSVADDAGSIVGALTSGASTDDTTPTLSGTAEGGSTISIYDGTTLLGTTTADASGSWTFTPTAGLLGEGAHSLTVTATDSSGNVSTPSAAFDLTVDTTAPSAPTVNPTDGTSLSGTAEAGATIQIDTNGDGTPDATVTADPSGAWTYTPSTPLPVGTQIGVTASDAAGNTSPSASVTVTGDVTAPAAPVIAGVTDDVGSVTGALVSGGSTDDTTPTLSGTAEAGSTISVFDGTTLLGTTTADASGNWTFTPAAGLGEGTHAITVTATDASGNVSLPSAAFDLTVDTTAPATPTVNPTDGTSLSGTAEAGATIQIDTNGDGTPDATVTADPTGAWTYTPATPLPIGTQIGVTASDAAGNKSPAASVTVTGDVTAPAAPIIVSVADDAGSITGALTSGASTDDTTPTLTGTAEGGSTISIYDGTTLLGTTTADASGSWTFTPTAGLGEGAHSLTVTATDSSGNVSTPSTAFDLTVDTTAPSTPTVNPTDGTSLSGTAEAGATIQIDTNGDGTPDATVTADPSGAWTYTPTTPLPIGTQIGVTASDAAGNTSPSATVTVTGDVTAPAAPVIASVTDDVGSIVGALTNGASTDDTKPTLTGTAEGGSTINVYDGSTLLGSTTADASGNWSFTPTTGLADGAHALTVTATDAAGNVSTPSAAFSINVDTVAPTATATLTTLTDNTGAPNDWVTGDTTPILGGTLSGALGAGEVVQVSLDGGAHWSAATVDGTNWTWYADGVLAAANYTATVRVVDAAGNIGGSTQQTFTIDPNVAPVVSAQASGNLLGIVGANLLNLIDLGTQQAFGASDYNNNIDHVTLHYGGLLGLGALHFGANQALANELGLSFNVVNNNGILGVIGPSSDMTITAADGGAIDNLKLNEFLGSITLTGGAISISALDSVTISATDKTGLSASATAGQLLNANLLGSSQSTSIVEGTQNGDTVNGTSGNDRLYGYNGDDVLNGGDGNDLLRGGAGNDTLNGGNGNDILIGGAGDDTLTGGAGTDVFLWEVVTPADNTGGNGHDVITDFQLASGPTDTGGDKIDLSKLLVGYTADADGPAHYVDGVPTIDSGDTIGQYLNVTNVGSDTVISIDRDGAGTAFGSETLVTLNNVTTNLETLLANHQIIV